MHFITYVFVLLFCMYKCSVDATPNYANKIAMAAKEMSTRADIQRGTILAWIVILSVYDADTEVKLLISPFLR